MQFRTDVNGDKINSTGSALTVDANTSYTLSATGKSNGKDWGNGTGAFGLTFTAPTLGTGTTSTASAAEYSIKFANIGGYTAKKASVGDATTGAAYWQGDVTVKLGTVSTTFTAKDLTAWTALSSGATIQTTTAAGVFVASAAITGVDWALGTSGLIWKTASTGTAWKNATATLTTNANGTYYQLSTGNVTYTGPVLEYSSTDSKLTYYSTSEFGTNITADDAMAIFTLTNGGKVEAYNAVPTDGGTSSGDKVKGTYDTYSYPDPTTYDAADATTLKSGYITATSQRDLSGVATLLGKLAEIGSEGTGKEITVDNTTSTLGGEITYTYDLSSNLSALTSPTLEVAVSADGVVSGLTFKVNGTAWTKTAYTAGDTDTTFTDGNTPAASFTLKGVVATDSTNSITGSNYAIISTATTGALVKADSYSYQAATEDLTTDTAKINGKGAADPSEWTFTLGTNTITVTAASIKVGETTYTFSDSVADPFGSLLNNTATTITKEKVTVEVTAGTAGSTPATLTLTSDSEEVFSLTATVNSKVGVLKADSTIQAGTYSAVQASSNDVTLSTTQDGQGGTLTTNLTFSLTSGESTETYEVEGIPLYYGLEGDVLNTTGSSLISGAVTLAKLAGGTVTREYTSGSTWGDVTYASIATSATGFVDGETITGTHTPAAVAATGTITAPESGDGTAFKAIALGDSYLVLTTDSTGVTGMYLLKGTTAPTTMDNVTKGNYGTDTEIVINSKSYYYQASDGLFYTDEDHNAANVVSSYPTIAQVDAGITVEGVSSGLTGTDLGSAADAFTTTFGTDDETFDTNSTLAAATDIAAIDSSDLTAAAALNTSNVTGTLSDLVIPQGAKVIKVTLGGTTYYAVGTLADTAGSDGASEVTVTALYNAAGVSLAADTSQGLGLNSSGELVLSANGSTTTAVNVITTTLFDTTTAGFVRDTYG